MKRVHNDHASASGSPPSGPTQQGTKGRKRKSEVPESQATNSRKSSVKSMPAEPKQPPTRPLIDQWMDHHKAVENLFRGLVKPEDARNIQHINDMQQRLSAMMKVTSDLNAITNGNFTGTG